jgi:hypothetical protein
MLQSEKRSVTFALPIRNRGLEIGRITEIEIENSGCKTSNNLDAVMWKPEVVEVL